MSIKKITDTYKKKIALIKKHNKYYYNEDKPQISDADYDKLKNEVLDLEKKNSVLDFAKIANNWKILFSLVSLFHAFFETTAKTFSLLISSGSISIPMIQSVKKFQSDFSETSNRSKN